MANKNFRPDPKPLPKEKKKVYFLKRSPLKKKKYTIRPRSKKRAEQEKEYQRLRKEWLPGKKDPENGKPAETVHHMKGRIGKLLTDTRYWLGVTMETHIKIENNPEWAYEKGYSLLRTAKINDENNC